MHKLFAQESHNKAFLKEGVIWSVQSGPQTAQSVGKLRIETEALIAAQRQAGKRVIVLADLREVHKTDSGARLEGKAFLDADFDALAIVGNRYLQPIIMYVVKITGKSAKVMYASSVNSALAWLHAPRVQRQSAAQSGRRLTFFQFASAAILVVVILSSGFSWYAAQQRLDNTALQNLQHESFQLQSALHLRMQAYTDTLKGFRGLFQSSNEVSEAEFNEYFRSLELERTYPGFNAISFATRVKDKDLAAFVAARRNDKSMSPQGNSNFSITPSGGRSEYYVITFVSSANAAGKGIDLRTNEQRRPILEKARDTAQPLATGTLNLLGANGQSQATHGFLLTLPVYSHGVPTSVSERQAQLTGFINAVFDYNVFFSGVVPSQVPGQLNVTIRDVSGNKIYETGAKPTAHNWQQAVNEVEIGGQTWKVEVGGPTAYGLTENELRLPRTILSAGIWVSGLLAALLWYQLRSQRRAVALAEAMTQDLQQERNVAVATKNKDEAILASIGDGVFALDCEGRIIVFNKAAERITGFTAAEAMGKPYVQALHFMHEKTGEPSEEFIVRAQAGQTTSMDTSTIVMHKSGKKVPVADSAAPIFDAAGVQQGVIVVFRDISLERQAQARLAQLAAIVESSEDAIVSNDRNGNIVSWNAGAERLYGYGAQEMIGRTWHMVMPPERRDELQEIFAKLNRGEQVTRQEAIHRTKDGSDIEVALTVSPINDEAGRMVGSSAIVRDITQEKHFERAIKESNERFELVAKATSEVVYDLTISSGTLWWNDTLYAQYGFSRDEATDSLEWWAAHVHPDDAVRVNDELTRLLQGNALTWTIEYRFQKADKSFAFVRDRAFVQRSASGEATRMVGSLLDVTKQKELDRAKDEFISLVSHQLRTPLTAIRLFTEMLTAGQVGELAATQRDYLEKIDVSTKRMIQLVGDILNISRIELGRLKIEPKPTDVPALMKSHLEEVQPLADEKGVKLSLETDDALPLITLDPTLFGQVLHNLMTNAIRYSHTQEGQVWIKFAKIKDGYELSVRDNGIGIPAAARPRIFERFFRADNAIHVEGEGTGLGLYLIHMIMQQAGGKVRFESSEGKGTTFFVWIPESGMQAKQGDKSLS